MRRSKKTSRERLETETFKTETTSLSRSKVSCSRVVSYYSPRLVTAITTPFTVVPSLAVMRGVLLGLVGPNGGL